MRPMNGTTDSHGGVDGFSAAVSDRRTFTRRIDCADSRGVRAASAPVRGGDHRDSDRWERSRREHG